jgi:hypothetical protein
MKGLTIGELAGFYGQSSPEVQEWMLDNRYVSNYAFNKLSTIDGKRMDMEERSQFKGFKSNTNPLCLIIELK